jgi:hypothetical protein
VLWEEEALTADRTFQAGLTQPEDCDIVLVILWTRLGSPLPEEPYRGMTGTEWEFVNAVEASARSGTPEVLVYKKTAPKLVDITDARHGARGGGGPAPARRVLPRHFFNEDNTFRRAFRTFDSDATFRELVETQLRKLLNRRISAERRAAAGSGQWQGSPFRADRPFDIGDERVFTGREQEVRTAAAPGATPRRQPGLLLLSGPSGSGKTSLLRAGLVPRLTRPFLFEHIATVRSALVNPAQDAATPLRHWPRASARRCAGRAAGGVRARRRWRLERLLAQDPELAAQQLGERPGPTRQGQRLGHGRRGSPSSSTHWTGAGRRRRGREPLLGRCRGSRRIRPSGWSRRCAATRCANWPRCASCCWTRTEPRRTVVGAGAAGARAHPPGHRDPGAGGRHRVRRPAPAAKAAAWWSGSKRRPRTCKPGRRRLQALLQNAYEQAQTAASAGRELRLTADQIQAAGGLAGTLGKGRCPLGRAGRGAQAALPRVCRALIAVEGAAGDHPERATATSTCCAPTPTADASSRP